MSTHIQNIHRVYPHYFIEVATLNICAWIIGGTLAMSGFAHASNPVYFLGSILQYGIFSPTMASLIAATLPWIEIGIASMLLLGMGREHAFVCCIVLSIGFVLVQSWALWNGLQIDCGCFGSLSARPVGVASFSLAAGVGVVSLFCLFMLARKEKEK